jgi:hypothetical protein
MWLSRLPACQLPGAYKLENNLDGPRIHSNVQKFVVGNTKGEISAVTTSVKDQSCFPVTRH